MTRGWAFPQPHTEGRGSQITSVNLENGKGHEKLVGRSYEEVVEGYGRKKGQRGLIE